jgi:hypothetical protein
LRGPITITDNVVGGFLGTIIDTARWAEDQSIADVTGKVLGGGASTITGTGVRAVDGSGDALATASGITDIKGSGFTTGDDLHSIKEAFSGITVGVLVDNDVGRRRDPQVRKQTPRASRVLARDYSGLRECLNRPRRNISEIAYGCSNENQATRH